MGLKWWFLLVPIAAAIGVAVWFALRRTRRGWQGELPFLARAYRLTALPEYQRALRLHQRLLVAALVMAIVAVTMLAGATLRPTKTYEPKLAGSDTPYVDIMFCFGYLYNLTSAEDLGMSSLMADLQDRVDQFGNQRIGMTNEFYRVFPVTADRDWVSNRLGEIAELADSIAANPYGSAMREDNALFERYASGYNPDPVDILAMCAMGLPAAGSDNGRGKMIVYVGNTRMDDDPGWGSAEDVPPERLYTKDTLQKTVQQAGIQVNTIVPGEITGPMGYVEKLVGDSGGQQVMFTDFDSVSVKSTPRHVDNQKQELGTALDRILSNPPPSTLDAQRERAMRPFQWDVPDLLLQLALLAAIGLAACRLGMRL